MRLVEKRRVWQGIAVTAAVLAMTVVLPAQPAAAAAGEVWIDASYGTGGATVLPDAYYGVRFSMDSTGRQYIGNQTLAEGTDLRRLTADGAVDLAFAGGNLALPRLIRDVHADASGTVTVVGSGPGITVSRFTSAGELDLGFGTGGSAVVPGSEQAQGYFGLLGRANGGYIVAYPIGPAPQTVLVALTSTGAVDGTWAPGSPQPGVLTTPDYTRSVVADGNAVVLLANPDANSPQGEYLRRLTPSGAPDPAFGTGGRLQSPGPPAVRRGYRDGQRRCVIRGRPPARRCAGHGGRQGVVGRGAGRELRDRRDECRPIRPVCPGAVQDQRRRRACRDRG